MGKRNWINMELLHFLVTVRVMPYFYTKLTLYSIPRRQANKAGLCVMPTSGNDRSAGGRISKKDSRDAPAVRESAWPISQVYAVSASIGEHNFLSPPRLPDDIKK